MNISKLATAAATAVLTLAFAGSHVAGAAAPSTSNGKQDVFNSRGSDTTFGALQRLGAIYNGSEGCTADTGNALKSNWINCLSSGGIDTENYDHDSLVDHDPFKWGSSKGVSILCAQNTTENGQSVSAIVPTESARSSRKPVSSDCTGLKFYGYARDGIIPINWRTLTGSHAADQDGSGSTSTAVNKLTKAQLLGIFGDCTITTWGQLNGMGSADTTPIEVWGVSSSSGTYQTFNEYIGTNTSSYPNGANSCVTAGDPDGAGALTSRIIQENDAAQILDSNGGTNNAANSIWYMSYGPWQSNVNVKGGSSQLAVANTTSYVSAGGTSIINGTYPISRYLYQVLISDSSKIPTARADAHAAAKGFVDWLCRNLDLVNDAGGTGAHRSATKKAYGTQIQTALNTEGFYANSDNSGTSGTDRCTNLTT